MNRSFGKMNVLSLQEDFHKTMTNVAIAFMVDITNGIADFLLLLVIISLRIFEVVIIRIWLDIHMR